MGKSDKKSQKFLLTVIRLFSGSHNQYTILTERTERYLHTSKQLKAVFLLIDIRHDPSANDKMMYQWIVDQGFQPIIIATKLDKLKRSQVQKHVKMLKTGLNLLPGTKVIPFSSVTKQGRDEIWDLAEREYLFPERFLEDETKE